MPLPFQLTKLLGHPPSLLRGFCHLKMLRIDPVLLHQSLALILMQVEVAHRHHTAGRQLDHGGGREKDRARVNLTIRFLIYFPSSWNVSVLQVPRSPLHRLFTLNMVTLALQVCTCTIHINYLQILPLLWWQQQRAWRVSILHSGWCNATTNSWEMYHNIQLTFCGAILPCKRTAPRKNLLLAFRDAIFHSNPDPAILCCNTMIMLARPQRRSYYATPSSMVSRLIGVRVVNIHVLANSYLGKMDQPLFGETRRRVRHAFVVRNKHQINFAKQQQNSYKLLN